ncbi:hypothetical protein D3C81_1538300 [compost metagenome]
MRAPGKASWTSASVVSMKSATRETGTAISCLMFLPSSTCAIGMCSRRFQKSRDCCTDSATTASVTTPASKAASIIVSKMARACASPSLSDSSSSTSCGWASVAAVKG